MKIHDTKALMSVTTTKDVLTVINALEKAVEGFPEDHVFFACLSLAYAILKTDADVKELTECVQATRTFMLDYIKKQVHKINFNLETIDIPPSQLQ